MTLPTASAVPLDQVYTRFAYKKIGGREYKDQKYKRRPLLRLLTEKKKSGSGGQTIVHPVNLGTTANGKSLARNEQFSIVGDANETWATYSWKVVIETCFVSWWDQREAEPGLFGMLSIANSRLNETRENIEDNILTMLCATSASVSTDITPILTYVATSGAAGGLNPATTGQSVWAAESESTINWSVQGVARSRELFNKIEDNKGYPDVVVLPDQYFNETCEIADNAVTFNKDLMTRGGTQYADLGAKVPLILNTPVIRDPAWNTTNTATGVALDLMGIHLVVDPRWDMYIWPFMDMAHFGTLGQATLQLTVCELTCSSRRTQGLLGSIS